MSRLATRKLEQQAARHYRTMTQEGADPERLKRAYAKVQRTIKTLKRPDDYDAAIALRGHYTEGER